MNLISLYAFLKWYKLLLKTHFTSFEIVLKLHHKYSNILIKLEIINKFVAKVSFYIIFIKSFFESGFKTILNSIVVKIMEG